MESSSSNKETFHQVTGFSIAWMKARFFWLALSLTLLTLSLWSIYHYNFKTTIDFNGGTLIEIGFDTNPNIPAIRNTLHDNGFTDTNVQLFGENNAVINLPNYEDKSPNDVAAQIKEILISNYDKNIDFRRIETVGPKVGDELVYNSTVAVLLSVIAMLLYIWVRFELPFAIGSVVALMHDIIITLGFLAFFQVDFGLPIIAALLTVVGYSMNDTVVIFDRIRENLIKYQRSTLRNLIDLSINEVFTRTLVTGGTTLISLVALLIFGGDILRPFVITITIGILIGTYSSIFVASPFLLFLNIKNNFKKSKKPKENIEKFEMNSLK